MYEQASFPAWVIVGFHTDVAVHADVSIIRPHAIVGVFQFAKYSLTISLREPNSSDRMVVFIYLFMGIEVKTGTLQYSESIKWA